MADNNKDDILNEVPYNDSPEANARFSDYWNLFLEYQIRRNQKVHFLNKNGTPRNILEYIEDSVDRMNEYKAKPSWKEDWQNQTFDPVTRDKVIAILSRMASTRMKPELILTPLSVFSTTETMQRKRIFSDLLEHANKHNRDDEQLIWEMYSGLSEGTVLGYESWSRDTRTVQYVKEYNPDTGEKKVEEIKVDAWDDVFGELVPVSEFYPETIWMNARDFKIKMRRCFRVQELTFASFRDKYKGFNNADEVRPAVSFMTDAGLPWGISSDIDPKNVEVIQYYDEAADKMGIWANGTEIYYGCLPWNHKKIPFWFAVGEPIHAGYLYGKSLPDKLMSMQDINNALLNSMLDQIIIALNSPIFVDGMTELDEGYLEPGRIIEIDPGSKVQKATLGAVDPTAFSMLNLIKRSMEESSVSAQAQGVPTGGRKTKFEVEQLQEGALNLAGLFLQMMEGAMAQKYWLRMYNILQYYSMPSRKNTGKKQFKFIVANDTELTNGKTGKRQIQIVGSKTEIPPKNTVIDLTEQTEGRPFDLMESKVETVFITRDYLMNKEFDLDIKIVPNSSIKDSKAAKQQRDIAFAQLAMNNQLFNQEAVARDLAMAFDKTDEILNTKQQQQPMPQGEQQAMGGTPGVQGQATQTGIQNIDMSQL